MTVRPQGPVTFTVRGEQKAVVKIGERKATVRIVQSGSPLPYGGGGGSDSHMTWTPPSAASTWMIPHNLGFKPQVTVLDGSGNVVYGNVQHLDLNVLTISFTVPFYGTAELG